MNERCADAGVGRSMLHSTGVCGVWRCVTASSRKKSHGHVLYTPKVASISEAWIDKKSRESARTRFQFH